MTASCGPEVRIIEDNILYIVEEANFVLNLQVFRCSLDGGYKYF